MLLSKHRRQQRFIQVEQQCIQHVQQHSTLFIFVQVTSTSSKAMHYQAMPLWQRSPASCCGCVTYHMQDCGDCKWLLVSQDLFFLLILIFIYIGTCSGSGSPLHSFSYREKETSFPTFHKLWEKHCQHVLQLKTIDVTSIHYVSHKYYVYKLK